MGRTRDRARGATVGLPMPRPTILVIDDEPNILTTVRRSLELEDYVVEVAGSAALGLIKLNEHDIELVSSFTTRSYLLDFGRLLTQGSTAEVMASPEMRRAYLGEMEVPT
mgnify:CR=1 FL=1